MLITIILLVLITIGIIIHKKSYDFEVAGTIVAAIFGIYLLYHCIQWSTVSYNYQLLVVKRTAFENTLLEARKNNSPYELAAIVKDISQFNQDLAEKKFDNTYFLMTDYIDDRTETLQPIK